MFQRFPIGKVITNRNRVFDLVYVCDSDTSIAWVDFMRGDKCVSSTRADVFYELVKEGVYRDYVPKDKGKH